MTNPGDDIYGSAEHQAFRETVRRFVQAELVPRAREFDERRIDKSLYRKAGLTSGRYVNFPGYHDYNLGRTARRRSTIVGRAMDHAVPGGCTLGASQRALS